MPNNVLCKSCFFLHLLEWVRWGLALLQCATTYVFETQVSMCCKANTLPWVSHEKQWNLFYCGIGPMWGVSTSPAEGSPPYHAAPIPRVPSSYSLSVFKASSHTVFALCLITPSGSLPWSPFYRKLKLKEAKGVMWGRIFCLQVTEPGLSDPKFSVGASKSQLSIIVGSHN